MIKIRMVSMADAAPVASLLSQLGYPRDARGTGADLARLSEWPGVRVLVACDGNEVVGMVQLSHVPGLAEPAYVEVRSLAVDAEWRNRGIGAQLLDEAQRWADQVASGRVRVRCNQAREAAHRFYRREGFTALKVQTLFERESLE